MSTTNSITTSDADLITYHTEKARQQPTMYFDQLTGRVVADISVESREAFLNDAHLQRFLSVKKVVWRSISELRSRGGAR